MMFYSAAAIRSGLSRSCLIVLAVGVAACGKSEPAPDVATTTAATPDLATTPEPDVATATPDVTTTPPDCVPHDVLAVLGSIAPDFAKLDGSSASICGFADDTRHCVVLDLTSGKRTSVKLDEGDIAHLPAFPAGFDDGLIKDEGRPVLKLCPANETRCKDLHVGQVLAGHFDARAARVVVTSLEEGKLNAHVYDAASGAQTLLVPIGESDLPNCTFAAFVGESLLISSGACTGGGKAWLVDAKTGARIADIGKREDAFVWDEQFAHIEGDVWVFRDASGKTAYIQDVATGEVRASIDIEKATDGTKPKGEHAFIFATASEVILTEPRPLIGTVIVASSKDGAIKQVHLPRPCP